MLKRVVRKKYALDLGSNNTRLWESAAGIIVNEPTVLAVSSMDGNLVAVGMEAKEMLGKSPETLIPTLPVQNGVITDLQTSIPYVKNLLGRFSPRFQAIGPDIMICTPIGATQVERKALFDTVLGAGASHAYLVDAALAASIGAGIPVSGASGHMIINIGSNVVEAAVLSLGGVILSETRRLGSSYIDQAILEYIKEKYGVLIGLMQAEEIKISIGSAVTTNKDEKMEVSGRDVIYGLPRLLEISSKEITSVILQTLPEILIPLRVVLENTPPELASDIIEKGIIMTGGGSLLRGLDKYVTEETGVPSHVAEEPLLCTVRGAGVVLENLELWKRSVLAK